MVEREGWRVSGEGEGVDCDGDEIAVLSLFRECRRCLSFGQI